MKLVIASVLILLILWLFIQGKRDNFQSNSVEIRFLKSSQACNLIKDIDYFQNFTELDLLARRFINENNIIKSYCERFLEFTEKEKKKIRAVLSVLPDNEFFKSWSFAKINSEVENGFPHTHKDTIFLSADTIKDSDKRLLYVLVHEQMHVIQRKNMRLFDKLYTKYLPFKSGKLNIEESFIDKMRLNPDTRLTPEKEYMYKDTDDKYYYLCAVYNLEIPNNLGDVDYIAVECKFDKDSGEFTATNNKVEITTLDNFNNYFRLTGNHYHPNEISAELIGIYYSRVNFEPSSALIDIERWIKENIS